MLPEIHSCFCRFPRPNVRGRPRPPDTSAPWGTPASQLPGLARLAAAQAGALGGGSPPRCRGYVGQRSLINSAGSPPSPQPRHQCVCVREIGAQAQGWVRRVNVTWAYGVLPYRGPPISRVNALLDLPRTRKAIPLALAFACVRVKLLRRG